MHAPKVSLPRRSDALVVALVRHGRTAWNAEGRFLGHTDVPLDAQGSRQAEALAASWRGEFDAVYSSPLARALGTARALAPEVTLDERLMELDQGRLEGLRAEEAMSAFPEFFEAWAKAPETAQVPGGETLSGCRDRAVAALTAIADAHDVGQRVAVVSHQLVIASLRCWVAGKPLAAWRSYRVGNTEMVGLARDPSGWRPLD